MGTRANSVDPIHCWLKTPSTGVLFYGQKGKTMKSRQQSGFTIVELLIVIVIIAILATITIVAYNGIQDRALADTVKSDLASFATKIELARVDSSDGGYPTTLTASMGIKATKTAYVAGRWNWYYCVSPDRSSYALGVVDTKTRGYYQSSSSGMQEGFDGTLGVFGGTSTCIKANTTTTTPGTVNTGGLQGTTADPNNWQAWVN